jgi:uncharacterized membrane protein
MNPDQNPYAPPRDFGMLPGAGPVPGIAPQGFDTREVFEAAWAVFKKQWPILIATMLLSGVPGGALSLIPSGALLLKAVEPNSLEYWILYAGTTLASMIVGYFFQVGYIRVLLDAARGKAPDFMAILSGFDRFFPLLATNVLLMLAICSGMVLLIVPGVIASLGLSLAAYYCVDERLGPIASLRASWNATRGHKVQVLVFMLAAMLVSLVGFLACCVGVLPAYVITYLAWGMVYIRLSGNAAAPFSTRGA